MKHARGAGSDERDQRLGEVGGKRRAAGLVVHHRHTAAIAEDRQDGARKVLAGAAVEPGGACDGEPRIGGKRRPLAGQLGRPIDGDGTWLGPLGVGRAAVAGEDKVGADGDEVGAGLLRRLSDVACPPALTASAMAGLRSQPSTSV